MEARSLGIFKEKIDAIFKDQGIEVYGELAREIGLGQGSRDYIEW